MLVPDQRQSQKIYMWFWFTDTDNIETFVWLCSGIYSTAAESSKYNVYKRVGYVYIYMYSMSLLYVCILS